MNLRLFKLYRVYLNPLNLSNVGDFFPGVEFLSILSWVKKRKENLSSYVHQLKRPIWRFHLVVVPWTSKKCTEKRDARA